MKAINQHPLIASAALLAIILLAVSSTVKQCHSSGGKAMDGYYHDMTRQALEVTAHLQKGDQVLVLVFDKEVTSSGDKRFNPIYRALGKKGLSVLHVERLVWDEDHGWHGTQLGFPYDEFLRVAREHPDADAVLSLCSMPYFSKTTERPDPSTLPPLLVVARGGGIDDNLDQLLDEGIVQAATVRRSTQVESGGRSADLIEHQYEVRHSVSLHKK